MAGRFRGAPGAGGGDFSDRSSSYGVHDAPAPNIQPQQSGRRPGSDGFDGPNEPRQNPFGPGMGFDPAKPVVKERIITNTRMELPPDAYRLENNFPVELPVRPASNTAGKAIQVRVNQFKVLKWPEGDVYQYDINIGNGAEKRGKILAVWNSKAVQTKLSEFRVPFLWDGNKIAWTNKRIPEQRIMIDFDAEKGRTPREGKSDTCYCQIKESRVIRLAVIQGYLNQQTPFDNSILESISFLDHLMRQGPSETYTAIKRSFFARGATTHTLDNCVVAMKGVYSSIRLCSPKASTGSAATGLAVNVDVANGTFWASQFVHQAARNYLKERNRSANWDTFRNLLKPVKDNKGIGLTWSEDFKLLRKMTKLKFTTKHRGKQDDNKVYTIKKFTWSPVNGGAHSKNTIFKWKDPSGNEIDISVFDYFKRVYNIQLQFWDLPLIEMQRGYMPMELATLVPNQRYSFKLSPDQTAAMIKFAVTRPKERIASIQHGIGMLKWNDDRYLNYFGLKIEPTMTLTNARLLPPPEVQYAGAKASPGTSGRWDLRGKKFFLPNDEPLNSWGFCIMQDCMPEPAVKNFIQVFIQTYTGHGGKVQNKSPFIYRQSKTEDMAVTVANFRTATGNQVRALPQILFYILPGKDSWVYERLKRNNECRFGMVSQCLNMAHVQKAQPQYCSNVCMKVNAKLGGTSCKVVNANLPFPRPTLIIGADVSHPAPGSIQASMCAMTVSFDKTCCRYAAAVQTNGHRVEMIQETNIRNSLMPLIRQWVKSPKAGGGILPQHIYYFRDGVSEGQYSKVLNEEVANMKKHLILEFGEQAQSTKWTVAVCTKRHHIRFFPKDNDTQAGDRNGNPLPGTLVENDITHPFEYDFYLNAHTAIQGTARPVHYQVLLDEAKVPVNDFQKMIYNFSYQYMRSTTPVSIFPAIYYAHLASNRARAHEAKDASLGPQGGQKFEERRQDAAVAANRRGTADGTSQTGSSTNIEVLPLVPLGNPENVEVTVKIRTGMWYI